MQIYDEITEKITFRQLNALNSLKMQTRVIIMAPFSTTTSERCFGYFTVLNNK